MNYLERLALEIREELPADALDQSRLDSLLLEYAVLVLAKGAQVSLEDVHNAWVAWMTTNGEQHEALVPFEELPRETQAKDAPFVTAIRAVSSRHVRE